MSTLLIVSASSSVVLCALGGERSLAQRRHINVTGQAAYYNAMLMKKPFTQW